jgi:hypothetical protein
MTNYIQFIGVDPSYRIGGFYVCIIANNLVTFKKINNFIDYVAFIDSIAETTTETVICIENSNETNYTFIGKNIRSAAAREKISRDVGKNQAISQMSVDYTQYRLKYNVHSVSPAEKGIKLSDKTVQLMFQAFGQIAKNYKGNKGEQDKRDAYKLAMQAKEKLFNAHQKKKL